MQGLYRPEFESDSCGFGLLAQMDGEPSHQLVRDAIGALSRLTHRGAVDTDGKSGDGCGLLLKLPEGFLRELAGERGLHLGERFGVGMVFLHPEAEWAGAARLLLAEELERAGLRALGWRPVPVDGEACGPQALKGLPIIEQLFVNAPDGMGPAEFERRLYLARRRCRKAIHHQDRYFYVASLSCRVIAYKGLVLPRNLPLFYRDLQDSRLAAALAVFHQRFSTNTWPEWRLAQPFRFLAHNGELNSIQGNRNWAQARSYKFKSPHIRDMEDIRPWVSMTGSDSCSLDNMLEALVMGGMDLFRAMRLLIPPAWQNRPGIDPDLRAFYEYHSMHMEPWDGPAGIVLTDGRYGACVMDRNGLRPARYWITADRRILLGSEVGLCPIEPGQIVRKGRLKPGEMLAVDTDKGELLLPGDIDARLARRRPYKAWLQAHARRLDACLDEPEGVDNVRLPEPELARYQKTFGLSLEELEQVLRALGENAKEPLGSMGDDTPLAVLSARPRSLFDYFRQQFAQVTNPPIDSLRESIVMSLETCLGREQNLFFEDTEHAARLVLASPVLSAGKFNRIRLQNDPRYAYARLNLNYPRGQGLTEAIGALCSQATAAVRGGRTLLLLSDREIAAERLPMHTLLAVGAVHHRLIREGLRCDANLLLETGCAINPHQFAALIGYGATAVYPYLAYACLARYGVDALGKYRQGINQGLRKILSKMGISSIASYRGAQLFEAVGLHPEVVDLCFTGTPSRIGGAGFAELEAEQAELSRQAWRAQAPLSPGGLLKYVHGGEYHAFNPDVVHALHQAVSDDDPERYRRYARLVNQRPPTALRDLLRLRPAARPLGLDQVEPVEEILPRFETGAMSLGALSPEAHETLAVAMNRLGGRSNSGEGGEDPARYRSERVSKIKQVASGRFGVTPEYLVNAEVLQIKIAQGAKPGEGGQLAGAKVNELIARLRYTRPGTPLISPPPHHDIYSIEDLAQLIFDLKQVNPDAWVSVKLVAEPGVGTVAAGVAKAYADQITIAGHDGGTGASPLSSVRYAGGPWELGLAETQQTLRRNGLRGRVRLQTDGGLKTGLDVVKAALLGAESYGFGTAALVAMGCKYLRICHLNNCATGVATQHEVLRGHFRGEAERVMGFFRALAEEVREHLAGLGVRSLEELIGRSELLEIQLGEGPKPARLDLAPLLDSGGAADEAPRSCRQARNPSFDRGELAERMLSDCREAIEAGTGAEFSYAIGNHNRSIGARLAGEIARRHGNQRLEANPIRIRLQGSAGQSLGAWNTGGLHLYLEGDANDYVGKGMAGGRIVLYPPPDSPFEGRDNVILGNTCLYGATGGRLYAAGQAGERFAVRNSGAIAVVEGVGDHGCEYMTGGLVVVLGPAGCNFGAGMTGGVAMVLDQAHDFADRYNHELVDIQRITTEATEPHREALRRLLRHYTAATGSPWGRKLLQDFGRYAGHFWLVKPRVAELGELLAGLREAA